MATVSSWTPFGVALDITATAGTVTRKSASQFTVQINVSWKVHWSGAETNYGMTASSGGGSATINKFGTYASSGSGSFTGTFTIIGNTAQTKSISVVFKNFEEDWRGNVTESASKTITLSVNVPAWTSYAVKYNANGGSGAPGSQTKWKDQTLTLSSTKPSRSGYTFQGWATSASGSVSYAAGANYTANANVTLYAVWKAITYTVSYNANGGAGAPTSQTKTHGVNLTLSSTKPTRSNYTFAGWATSANGSVAYAAGATYTTNANVTLYAVWNLSYTKPRITGISAQRCNSSGAVTSNGTYALVKFGWVTDFAVSSIKIVCNGVTTTVSASGTSGNVSQVIGADALNPDNTYKVTITVADSNGSMSTYVTLGSTIYPIDVLHGGNGIAFGRVASWANTVEMGWPVWFRNGIKIPDERDQGLLPDTYGASTIHFGFHNDPGDWCTIMHVKGWSGEYATTELAFPANTNATKKLMYRVGIPSSGWNPWRTLLDDQYVTPWSNIFRANSDNTLNLGDSTYRWKALYSVNGTIQTSDRNAKENIKELDERYVRLFSLLKPISYELIGETHDRVHIGFIAQDVKAAMDEVGITPEEFAAYCCDKKVTTVGEVDPETGEKTEKQVDVLDADGNPVYLLALRYTEFVALNTRMIQLLQEENRNLKSRLERIESMLGIDNVEQ